MTGRPRAVNRSRAESTFRITGWWSPARRQGRTRRGPRGAGGAASPLTAHRSSTRR